MDQNQINLTKAIEEINKMAILHNDKDYIFERFMIGCKQYKIIVNKGHRHNTTRFLVVREAIKGRMNRYKIMLDLKKVLKISVY